MSIKIYDCSNSAPAYNYTPWGYACWWHKPLPVSLKANIGPVTIPTDCGVCTAECYNFPTVATDITLTRVNPCDWQSGVLVWYNSNYETGLTLFVNTYQKIFQDDPDISPITNVFSFSGCPNPTGTCNYNFETGKTSGTISGVAQFEPQGCTCITPCLLPFTVYFDEAL